MVRRGNADGTVGARRQHPAVIRTIPPSEPHLQRHLRAGLRRDAGRRDLRLYRRLHAGLCELRSAGLRHGLLLSAGDHCGAGADFLSLSRTPMRARSGTTPAAAPGRAAARSTGRTAARRRGGSYYNPNTGAWAHGGAVYGPNGGAGAWSAYNPSTGSYAHGSASWSNGSGSANASYYNARTGVSGSTNQNVNPYGRSGSSTFSGPNQTVNTQSGANANGRAGGFNSSTGRQGRRVPEQCHRRQRRCRQNAKRRRVCRSRRQRLPTLRQRLVEIRQRLLEPGAAAVEEHDAISCGQQQFPRAARSAAGSGGCWHHGSRQLPTIGSGSSRAAGRQRPLGRRPRAGAGSSRSRQR